ncbi:hypothetical protein [Nocardia asiatica]|uniref:hypothetical protein n=1 Tax=Nocardia asiatica TaxID=209252 RepID=UPI0002E93388|nr:hypothetical protein [Nocardia asiatica]
MLPLHIDILTALASAAAGFLLGIRVSNPLRARFDRPGRQAVELPREVAESLRKVLAYRAAGEAPDYSDNPYPEHVFADVRRVKTWLDAVAPAVSGAADIVPDEQLEQ